MTNTTDQLRAELTAKEFIKRLELIASDSENGIADLGMGQVFALAKEFIDTPLHEVEKLLGVRFTRYALARSASWTFRHVIRRQPLNAEKNCSVCISADMTASTPGTWLIVVLFGLWGVICSTSRAKFYINLRVPNLCLNVALQLSPPFIS